MKKALIFIGCIILAYLPALGGLISRPDAWYQSLVKPPLHPPSWIFAPVWTTLYLLIGIAHGLYTTTAPRGATGKQRGHVVYLMQLALNAAWSPLFFGARAPLAAGIEILVLLIFIAMTMAAFAKVARPAALLLLPYLAWVTFASYLNWGIVVLNR